MNFKDFETQHPEAMPVPEYITQEAAEDHEREQTRQENEQTVAALKESIKKQLIEGNEPQYVLYTAIRTIEILSNDPSWAEECKAQLNAVYDDIAQQSLIIDAHAVELARLEKAKADYSRKIIKRVKTDIRNFQDYLAFSRLVLEGLEKEAPPDPEPKPSTECREAKEIITMLAAHGYDEPRGECYGEYKTRSGVTWQLFYNPLFSYVALNNSEIGGISTISRHYQFEQIPSLLDHTIEPSRRPEAGSWIPSDEQ